MRTSRLSHDTTRISSALARGKRALNRPLSPRLSPENEAQDNRQGSDQELQGMVPSRSIQPEEISGTTRREEKAQVSRKRKRTSTDSKPTVKAEAEEAKTTTTLQIGQYAMNAVSDTVVGGTVSPVNREEPATLTSNTPKRKPKRAFRAVKSNETGAVSPPPHWEEVYKMTKAMRARVKAPVDTMGCERLADVTLEPKVQRLQTLVSLMLSSQTKDEVTAAAIHNLQDNLPGGLTVPSLLATDAKTLDSFIGKVGFHNTKTKNIHRVAEILKKQYNSDIPRTLDGLLALPGVGPKMAHLCLSAAWNDTQGIGVDVHVHRITNLWGWHETSEPEETRKSLERWLPKELWHEINHLLVGFGQTICKPVGRKCGECDLAPTGLCPSAVVGRKVVKKTKAVKEEAEKSGAIEIEVVEDVTLKVAQEVADIEDLGVATDDIGRRRSRRLKA